jgi:hypothetical protein
LFDVFGRPETRQSDGLKNLFEINAVNKSVFFFGAVIYALHVLICGIKTTTLSYGRLKALQRNKPCTCYVSCWGRAIAAHSVDLRVRGMAYIPCATSV